MSADTRIEDLLRDLAPQVLGALVRHYGHFDRCEDAVQEALLAASVRWPVDGLPDHPKGWLITVGSRRLTDELRSDEARRRREDTDAALAPADASVVAAPDVEDAPDQDDTLLAPVPVLRSCALAGVATRVDAAGGRWSDDERDRACVLRARSDHGAAHQPGEAAREEHRYRVRDATRIGARRPPAGRPPRALPDLQRGLHRDLGRRSAARRPDPRSDPPHPPGPSPAPRRRRSRGTARAHAADGRAPRRAYRAPTAR